MWSLALSMALAQPAEPDTAAKAIQAIAADLSSLPTDARAHARYLMLWYVPPKNRGELSRVLSGQLNSLSSEPDLIPPLIIGGGLALRLDVRDYGQAFGKAWDKLVDPNVWVKDANTGKYQPAPWLIDSKESLAAYHYLREYSGNPVSSAQWFLWQTATQEGRGDSGYYDFLGVKDQKTWEKLVRFNAETAKDLEHRRAVIFSNITLEPRRVEFEFTVLGAMMLTKDQRKGEGINAGNALRVLDKDLTFAATERFSPLPNGMPAWLLANDKGVRQDKAPDDVIQGDWTGGRHKSLLVGISCVRCHASIKGEAFVKDIEAAPIREIRSPDYAKVQELRRAYLRQVNPVIFRERTAYAAAVKGITGMEVHEYATAYGRWYGIQDDGRMDAESIGAYFGVKGEVVIATFRTYDRATRQLDPVLSIVMNGGTIPIRQWEEAIPAAWGIIVGGQKR